MLDLFSTAIQKKFCEGFLFFPFKRLKKSGAFIYKQYAQRSGIRTILNLRRDTYDFHCHYATVLHDKIATQALPQSMAVLKQLEGLYETADREILSGAELYTEFNDVMTNYYKELNNFQSIVMLRLQHELRPLVRRVPDDHYMVSGRHNELQRLIKLFISQGNMVISFLQHCIDSGAASQQPQLEEIITAIQRMNGVHDEMVAQLQQWELIQAQHTRQVYFN
ncbi:hypothetical protein [Chitinophaga vietnamensis]|uniref:hypothetical protein n=1 Tax=Chitinophaga vietnamensis TaxID=2593957 RepID=UPI001178C3CF|nr:hypothetical protein [Chitinophaga vietnamensis]